MALRKVKTNMAKVVFFICLKVKVMSFYWTTIKKIFPSVLTDGKLIQTLLALATCLPQNNSFAKPFLFGYFYKLY